MTKPLLQSYQPRGLCICGVHPAGPGICHCSSFTGVGSQCMHYNTRTRVVALSFSGYCLLSMQWHGSVCWLHSVLLLCMFVSQWPAVVLYRRLGLQSCTLQEHWRLPCVCVLVGGEERQCRKSAFWSGMLGAAVVLSMVGTNQGRTNGHAFCGMRVLLRQWCCLAACVAFALMDSVAWCAAAQRLWCVSVDLLSH